MTALGAAHRLAEVDPGLVSQVAAYRAGYLPEDRRALEQALSSGMLTGAATTNALELGVDIAGLDAVVVAGFPGTVASFWQQAGRSGRRGQGSLVVLVARDDPLDTYLVHHPEALLDKPIEAVVIDPTNPHVLRPHLLCAATELPLTEDDVRSLDAGQVVSDLVDDGLLRQRPGGYFAAPGLNPYAAVDIRGSIGGQIMILEADTGRVLGTVDTGRAPATVHPGAVYLHSGETYVVDSLDFGDGIALVYNDRPDYSTFARSTIDIAITGEGERIDLGDIQIGLVPVDVTHQVIGYLRKLTTGEILDFVELDMPSSTLSTKAVMYTVTPEALAGIDIDPLSTPGALHAAEHAAIGLLPLVASCDRGDIGGVSTALQPETGLPTVFVYDGHPGGAGFAARGTTNSRPGWAPRPTPSTPANAMRDAHHVCNHPSAATEIPRWTRALPSRYYGWCSRGCRARTPARTAWAPRDSDPRPARAPPAAASTDRAIVHGPRAPRRHRPRRGWIRPDAAP